jgi:hypothetical protein
VWGDVAVGGPAEFWQDRRRAVASDLSVTFWMPNSQTQFAALTKTKRWAYNPAMALKHAALFALIGMTLLTVLLAAGFIRDFSAFLSGAVAAMALLKSGIHLLASLSVAVFLYVFHKAQF